MLLSARYTWRDRDGSRSDFVIMEPIEREAADTAARGMGWPGHRGRFIDYLRDDLRALWRKLRAL